MSLVVQTNHEAVRGFWSGLGMRLILRTWPVLSLGFCASEHLRSPELPRSFRLDFVIIRVLRQLTIPSSEASFYLATPHPGTSITFVSETLLFSTYLILVPVALLLVA
jgi:hypothetical protein